jgi:hypothetical protein
MAPSGSKPTPAVVSSMGLDGPMSPTPPDAPQTEAAFAGVIDRLLELEPAADAEGRSVPFPPDLTPEAKDVEGG